MDKLERQKSEQNTIQNPGPFDRVVYDALAVYVDFELRQLRGGDDIARTEVDWSDDASYFYVLMFGIDLHVLGAFEDKISVRQYVSNAGAQRGAQRGAPAGGSTAIQFLIVRRRGQIGQSACR